MRVFGYEMGRKLDERGSEIRGIQGQMDEEEQWKDIATYTSRVCTIALVPDRTFASDFAVNVSGKKMLVSAASVTPKPLRGRVLAR